jgi:hypothetical protein
MKSLLVHNCVKDSLKFEVQVHDSLDWMKVRTFQDIFYVVSHVLELFSKWNFANTSRKYSKLGRIHKSFRYLQLYEGFEWHISTGKWGDISRFCKTDPTFYKAYHISLHNKNILTVHLFPIV